MSMSQDILKNRKINALDLMIMSVYKPDVELRSEAFDLGCLDDLMEVREDILEYLQEARKFITEV